MTVHEKLDYIIESGISSNIEYISIPIGTTYTLPRSSSNARVISSISKSYSSVSYNGQSLSLIDHAIDSSTGYALSMTEIFSVNEGDSIAVSRTGNSNFPMLLVF